MPCPRRRVDFWAEHTSKEGRELRGPHLPHTCYMPGALCRKCSSHTLTPWRSDAVSPERDKLCLSVPFPPNPKAQVLGNLALSSVVLELGLNRLCFDYTCLSTWQSWMTPSLVPLWVCIDRKVRGSRVGSQQLMNLSADRHSWKAQI